MAKYINADEYKKKLRKRYKAGIIGKYVLLCEFKAINEMPAADVVEVVRCEDCKKHHNLKFHDCLWTDDDFFCADGERKETY